MLSLKQLSVLTLGVISLSACGGNQSRPRYSSADSLGLDRVVLYRNGVGYFERQGDVEGQILRIRVRKDQVNDLLKSLTIVDKKTGQAVSVSMPLDPQTWANAANGILSPSSGSLAQVLDSLRGQEVALDTVNGAFSGRVVMVERIVEEPDPTTQGAFQREGSTSFGVDHKVTLLNGDKLEVVRLSKVQGIALADGDLAMQLHRRLDAAAGEGMFQQVEVAIRLLGNSHDLVVSYVVEAPMWKPTYRVVLPKDPKEQALLQAWAVVDNTSGEDWSNVSLSLAAGAPIAFKYDLHTPRNVAREDLSRTMTSRRARVAMGETSFNEVEEEMDDDMAEAEPTPEPSMAPREDAGRFADRGARRPRPQKKRSRRGSITGSGRGGGGIGKLAERKRPYGAYASDKSNKDLVRPAPSIDVESLRRSTLARAKAQQASGVTRFDLNNPVTVPDGSSTMVAIVNEAVTGEETFLFKPGGAGQGYESNPYRVVRFKNSTPFVLESGPISIFSGGNFVGEGISETVGAGTSVTIPFAVENSISVAQKSEGAPQEVRLLKIVRGVMHVERFHQRKTTWTVRSQTKKDGFRVYVRHPKLGANYALKERPEGTEDLVGAYLVPVSVPVGKSTGEVTLLEQSPSQTTISIWDGAVIPMLQRVVASGKLSADARKKLQPLIDLRQEVGKIDTKLQGLRSEQGRLNRRVELHQRTLETLRRDNSGEAARMRRDAAKAVQEFGREGDEIARKMAQLERDRLRANVKLEELLENLTLDVAK